MKKFVSHRSRTLALWAISVLTIVPLLQYLPVQVDLLLSGKIQTWKLSKEQYQSVGFLRYIKDIYYLGFAFLWPLLLLQLKDRQIIGAMLIAIGIELFIVCLGLVGHTQDPVPLLLIGGFRWILLLHCAVGTGFLVIGYRLWQVQEALEFFKWLVTSLIFINFVFVFAQWWLIYWPYSSTPRFNGLFPNSGVLAFYMIGICLFLLVLPMAKRWHHSLFLLVLVTMLLSGSRAGIVIVLFTWLISWLIQSKKMVNILWFLSPLLVVALFFSIRIAEHAAGRGTLAETNLEGEGGRLSHIFRLINVASNSSFFDVFFGKGLGYGTNTAVLLSVQSSAWQTLTDNMFAVWFLQMGIVGITTLLFYTFLLVYFSLRSAGRNLNKRIVVYTVFFNLLMLSIGGNCFEQFGFMPFLGLVMGFMLSKYQYANDGMRPLFKNNSIILFCSIPKAAPRTNKTHAIH